MIPILVRPDRHQGRRGDCSRFHVQSRHSGGRFLSSLFIGRLGRDSQLLDPAVDPARVRAMYTNPAYARRGVGRLILSLCEAAAAAEGFARLELMSTLSGEPLYTAYGFRPLKRLADATGGAAVPLVRMEKAVDPSLLG